MKVSSMTACSALLLVIETLSCFSRILDSQVCPSPPFILLPLALQLLSFITHLPNKIVGAEFEMKISFGKGKNNWNNYDEKISPLVKRLQPEIQKFGDVIKWIHRLEPIFIFVPIRLVRSFHPFILFSACPSPSFNLFTKC